MRDMALFLILAAVLGCSQMNMDSYRAMAQTGFDVIVEAREIDRLFPDCDHFLGSGPTQTNEWNSEAFIFGRYILTMKSEVIVDKQANRITQVVGAPRFYISEVIKVSTNAHGSAVIDHGDSWEMDVAQWKKVVKANGDFGAAGINLQIDRPVPKFDIARKEFGKDRPTVKPR